MRSGSRAGYIFQICSTTHCSSPPIEAKMKELGQRLLRVMKILVPADGSPASIRAVKLAIDQAKVVAGASIVVVNVQNLSTLGLAEGAGIMPLPWIEQEEERASSEALQEAATVCREAEVTYVTRSERGGIAETIDRVAREEHVNNSIEASLKEIA
jgi:nucleotide-binding universal stress UspA family protein